jgi:threonine dehydratase
MRAHTPDRGSRPTLEDVRAARRRLEDLARRTPLIRSPTLARLTGADVRIKLETVQETGSFKIRGAGNAILSRMERTPAPVGLVTYSTGNHGRATAHVGLRLGLPVTVCMAPSTAPDKQAALAELGADLRLTGASQDDAHDAALTLARYGRFLVDPINDAATTAGHGTIGLELAEQWPDVDTVVVPVSGGALASGVALALRAANPDVRVVGVSMEHGAAMFESLRTGRPVIVPEYDSLADSLQGGITLHNTHTMAMVRDLVDDLVLVSEDEIALAMTQAFATERLVLEGAAATPIAALLHRERRLFGDRIALVASGGMVPADRLCAIAAAKSDDLAAILGGRAA